MLSISTSVSQMLSSIGGGIQNNQMLELMVALLILMSMMEQQRDGNTGGSALGQLGAGVSASSFSYSSVSVSTQITSIEYTQGQINQINLGNSPPGGTRPKLDAIG